ncbi:MAG: HAD-IB family phosphatase [Candidatus Hermodarchaeota archaeon]|nr:HAD-IB family phosphatase [Candidatus Hermodarchaeota archaeon]
MSPRGLIAFDLDGTLVYIGSAWSWIHRLLGTLERAKPNAEQYFAGKIDYTRWAELDVALWHGVPLNHIETAVQRGIELIPNASELISTLRSYGFKTAIISSGLAVFANQAQAQLQIDYSRANRLLTDTKGQICGVEVHVAFENKGEVLEDIAKDLRIPLNACVAIGDSRNDISMFQRAGFSIAFNPSHEEVASAAMTIIRSQNALELLRPIQEHFHL